MPLFAPPALRRHHPSMQLGSVTSLRVNEWVLIWLMSNPPAASLTLNGEIELPSHAVMLAGYGTSSCRKAMPSDLDEIRPAVSFAM